MTVYYALKLGWNFTYLPISKRSHSVLKFLAKANLLIKKNKMDFFRKRNSDWTTKSELKENHKLNAGPCSVNKFNRVVCTLRAVTSVMFGNKGILSHCFYYAKQKHVKKENRVFPRNFMKSLE